MGIEAKVLIRGLAPFLLAVSVSAASGKDLRLIHAVQEQNWDVARALLSQRVEVNTVEADGSTAMAWAAHWNDLQTAELLIHAGANVNSKNDFGVTPLWEACNNASALMVGKLAQAGADTNATLLFTGETALLRCANTGNADAVRILLAHGANPNAKENQKGQTALMWALEERHPEVARVLIEHGADIRAHSKGGFTPLLFAARQGDVASAQLLLDKGADINEMTPTGLSVLLIAIDCNREAFARFLVQKGANPNVTDRDGLAPLHYALRKGISILLYVTENTGNRDYLFRPNMRELVKDLLEHGANPNARIAVDLPRYVIGNMPQLGLAGATPFLLAAAAADIEVMRSLLKKGADPNLPTFDNTTPLMVAAGIGRRSVADRTNDEQKSAFEAVKLLVELGADVNAVSKAIPPTTPNHQVSWNDGLTALHGAALDGADDIIQFLAEKGAKLDHMDRQGRTPLSIAEGDPNGLAGDNLEPPRGHESTARLLRKLGANTLAQTQDLTSSAIDR